MVRIEIFAANHIVGFDECKGSNRLREFQTP